MAASKCNQMIKKITTLCALLVLTTCLFAQDLVPRVGMIIRKSGKIRKGTYVFSVVNGRSVLIVEGKNLVLDFNGSKFKGAVAANRPDSFTGTALLIRNSQNVTVRNLSASGFFNAISARNVTGLKIEECNLGYNARPLLKSMMTLEDKSPSPDVDYKEIGVQEGVSIYLRNCSNVQISNTRITAGFHGLVMDSCSRSSIFNNDFSFNSGIAVSLLNHSNNNRILFNRLNFNAGSNKSGGLFITGGSRGNTIYKNSATHCRYGIIQSDYLAAESTDSIPVTRIWNNDFSFSPNAGIWINGGRVHIADNRVYDCVEGFRASDISSSVFNGNRLRRNSVGIELGQSSKVQIVNNLSLEDTCAIRINGFTGNTIPNLNSGPFIIAVNSFNRNRVVYDITATEGLKIFGNIYGSCDTIYKMDSAAISRIDTSAVFLEDTAVGYPFIPSPADPFKGNGRFAGKNKLIVTSWGPYNFSYPLIVLEQEEADTAVTIRLLGAKRDWKILRTQGLENLRPVIDSGGTAFTATLTVPLDEVRVEASFDGPAFIDEFGRAMPHSVRRRLYYNRQIP